MINVNLTWSAVGTSMVALSFFLVLIVSYKTFTATPDVIHTRQNGAFESNNGFNGVLMICILT
ncbi:hypothetical protein VCHA50P415_90089 [Vibrio chagasii]|nr:hypothetical protein VCHA36O163_100093 [Vibrio chagasii]CAH6795790.1 hypothetical protein VCHA31O71_100093 [Vibrio chagasii]CAH6798247.1 hypothetical protein VCHA32O87_100078 [Vibrio chagasii]CAH6804436.1 hypothetical protein VCHA34P121_110079 [Vibrio chagasii]CAH6804740.1 hypothetical protein VCHA34P114_120023 [Vibrio chagasii]